MKLSPSNIFRAFTLFAVLLTGRALPAADVQWINPLGGNWSVPGNWSTGTMPGSSDAVLITNSGTYTVTLDVDATIVSLTLGGVSGTQTFSASSRTFTFNGACAINSSGVMAFSSSTVAGAGMLINQGTMGFNNSTINANLVNQGLLVFRGPANNLGGSFANQATGTVRVLGDGNFDQAIVNVALGFTNSGLIELTSVVNGQPATLNVNSGSLVNAVGGVINALAGTGGPRVLGVQLDNRGTVTINQALNLNGTSADHLNSGTISLVGGDFTVSQGGSTPSFTTTGTIDIGSGRTFTVSGGTFNYNAGTMGGAGTLSLSSTVANFTPNFSNATTTLRLAGSTLNGPGTVTNATGQTISLDNSTINANLVNQGLLVFRGPANNLGGSFANQATGTVRVLGDGNFDQAIVNVALGFTNSGLIELTSVVNGQPATLNVNSGSLVNAVGGVINALAGTGGPRVLGVQLDNRGTVTINQALNLNGTSADHLNSGTISLVGGDFTVSQGGSTPSFTTTGTIDIGSGRTFTVSGGTFNYNAGTMGGAGTLSLSSTVANFTPNFSNATTTLRLAGSTLNGPGTVTNATGQTISLDNSTINANLVNQGLLVFRGPANNLGGSFANQATGTVRVLGDGNFDQAIVNVALGFTNSGLIELTSVVNGQPATLNVNSGSLVNAVGGVINALAGTGGPRVLGVQLDNRGTVTINQALNLNGTSADHLNSGTISLVGGDFTVSQGGSTPSFTTTGTIDIGSGRTFTVSGGTFNYNAGTMGGAGTLSLSSTVANFTPNFSNATTTLRLAGSTLNGPGTVTNATGQTISLDNSTINANLVNQGLLVFRGPANNLGGSFANQATGTVRVLGDGNFDQAIVNVALGFTNSGLIELTSVVNGQPATLNVNSGSLVNAVGGVINALAGTGGPRVLGVQLDNRGTVTINQALNLNGTSADHLNSGTISLVGGDFTVSQGGSTPSFTTTGTIDIGSGRTFTVSGGTFNYNAGTMGGAGTLSLSSTVANFTPNFSNATTTLRLAGSTLNGPGTVTNATGQTISLDNSTINANLVNQGLLVFRGPANNLGGSFANQATGTVRVLGDGNFDQAIVNVALGFTNSGLIELTSVVNGQPATLNVNSGSLVNAVGGVINALAGTGGPRVLGVQLDNRGTVTINQALNLNGTSADHLNSGTISLVGGDFTVSQGGSTPSFTTTGTIDIGSGRTFTVSGGTFNYNAGTMGGAGTLSLSSTVANFTPNFSNATTTLRLAGSTLNGPGTVTNATGQTISLDNSTINANLVNQGLLVFRGPANNLGGSFANQATGTVRVLGDGNFDQAIVNVALGFTNSGLIELTSVVNGQPATLNVNSGSLVNAVGGVINALAGTGGPRVLGVQLDNRGTVTINQALNLNGTSADHLNSGTISLVGGDFTLNLQNGSTPSFTNVGVITISSNRTFTASGGTFVNATPGIIAGFGTLNVQSTSFANAGNINPGTSPGILTVGGDFPQTASGNLNIEIGGRTAGVDYDQFNITGHATLDGTLNIQLINGFRPSGGDSFEIIRYNSHAGFFDHIVGLNIGGGFLFQPVFTATNVVLTTIDTRPRIVFQSAEVLSGGQVEFTLGGTAGQDFVIEAATNLAAATWIPVLTNTNSGAVFTFIVTDATNFSRRFYRARQ